MQVAFHHLVAFQLRLGYPGQDVVVTADVGHEVHRLAAPGVTVAGLAVPLLLRQARQYFLHIQPFVWVQAFLLRQLACVIQVAPADVVGRQGKPGAIRFENLVVQFALDHRQVLGAPLDTLPRVQAIGHAHGLGGVLGQHHQAAHAGLGGDRRLPQRLLVTNGCQEPPIDLFFLGRGLEELLVLGQALLQVLGKGVGADIAQYIDMPVITILEALQGAVLLDLVEVAVDLVEQAVVFARGHGPALVAGVAQVEGHPHVGEVHLVHRHFIGVDQGQVDLPFVDHAQQVDHFNGVGLFVFNRRILLFQRGQLLGMGAALEHHDLLAHQVGRVGGAGLAVAVDDLRGDFQVRMGKPHLLFALFAADQAGGCKYRAVGFAQLAEQVVEVVGGLDFKLDPQVVGKALDQFVFKTGFAVAVLEIGGRAVSGNHPQYAILLDSLERAGLINTGAEQQEESGGDEPFGASRAQSSWGEHLRSIRKRPTAPYLDSMGVVC